MTSAFELWGDLSKELNHQILEAAYVHEKRLYRHAVQDLSGALRKRPQLILEIPRGQRHELFQPLLALPHFDTLGYNLVINWLGTCCTAMLVDFLDAAGVAHNGKGTAEEFPESVPVARLEKACTLLYGKYPPEQVTLYLKLFPNITGAVWEGLEKQVRKA